MNIRTAILDLQSALKRPEEAFPPKGLKLVVPASEWANLCEEMIGLAIGDDGRHITGPDAPRFRCLNFEFERAQ